MFNRHPMKTVVLDGHTLNPGDLDWSAFNEHGDCVIHPRSCPEEIADRAADADAIITNKTPVTAATIAQLPSLKYIGVTATGYNVVDVEAARGRNITVTNVPSYGTVSVAQHAIALLLELTNQAGRHSRAVATGGWVNSIDWSFTEAPITELDQLTFGVIGWGRIGSATARIARSFGMNIITHSRTPKPQDDVTYTNLDTLLSTADVISLHCPLTPETDQLINPDRLRLMKPTSLLINTSRGQLLDEAAVANALNDGRLAGAGLDVLSSEPPAADNPLLTAKNCIVTPHNAWASRSARQRLLAIAGENLRAFANGTPQNVVN
jgi:glycerate dehydrogenase